MVKPKHYFRAVALGSGVLVILLALIDGYSNLLPYIDAQWLLGAGVILVGIAARKSPVQVSK